MKCLFPYQKRAIADTYAAWEIFQRVLTVMPTGTGKTFTFSMMIRDEARAGKRVLVVVDATELVKQTVRSLSAEMPDVYVGVVQAARNQALAPVIVASIQTLKNKKRRDAVGRFDLIVIDEAHMAAAQSYIDVLTDLGAFDVRSGVRMVGFTATPDRAGDLGLGDIWQHVAHVLPVEYAFTQGYLVRPEIRRVRLRSRDPQTIADTYLREAGHRQGVVFTSSVRKAHRIAAALNAAGIPAGTVSEATPEAERERMYARINDGSLRVLTNVNVLVKGIDLPRLEVAVVDRKMQQVAYVQAVGRVLRIFRGDEYAPPKTGALVLELCENTHSLQVDPNLAPTIEGKREKATERAQDRQEAPRKPVPVVRYRIHERKALFGRRQVIVERIEPTGTFVVGKFHGHPTHHLVRLAREAVEQDKQRRMEALRARIRDAVA